MTEEETPQQPQMPQIPQTVDTSSLLSMLKNPYVLTILKKNPEEVKNLLSSLGSTSELMAMAYIQGNHPDLYEALQGITPTEEQEPRTVLELSNDEYNNIMREAYETANARDLTNPEVSKWIRQEHNAEIPPAKILQAFTKIEKDNHDQEPEEEEEPEDNHPYPPTPQNSREEQNQNTKIIQDLLRRKKESDQKAKEAEEAQKKAEEKLTTFENQTKEIFKKQEAPHPPEQKKGLIRKLAAWIY